MIAFSLHWKLENNTAIRFSLIVAKFHVRDTWELTTDRQLFVMAGTIVEGTIQKGMFVRIRLNDQVEYMVRIYSIEFARREGREDVCLCIAEGPEISGFLSSLNIKDENLEVTREGED